MLMDHWVNTDRTDARAPPVPTADPCANGPTADLPAHGPADELTSAADQLLVGSPLALLQHRLRRAQHACLVDRVYRFEHQFGCGTNGGGLPLTTMYAKALKCPMPWEQVGLRRRRVCAARKTHLLEDHELVNLPSDPYDVKGLRRMLTALHAPVMDRCHASGSNSSPGA